MTKSCAMINYTGLPCGRPAKLLVRGNATGREKFACVSCAQDWAGGYYVVRSLTRYTYRPATEKVH